jgi:hypothetical protein
MYIAVLRVRLRHSSRAGVPERQELMGERLFMQVALSGGGWKTGA